MRKNDPKIVNAWCMYDWANSVHNLVITASVFPVYFSATARAENGSEIVNFFGLSVKNTVLFSYAVSASFLFIAILIPFCTAIADYTGRKKTFMRFFCYLGAISSACLFFFKRDTLEFSVIAFMSSLVGWSGSIVFYNSFLPEIATEDNFDRYSARGFALGYLGAVILMLFNLSMIMFPNFYGINDNSLPARLSFLSVGIWWVAFAQIPLKALPNNVYNVKPEGRWIFNGFRKLAKVFGELKKQKLLPRYLIAFFIFNMGVQTVMYVATLFGANELKLPAKSLITTILLIQIIGIAGSYFFSWLSGKLGNIYALMIGVATWIGICSAAYYVAKEEEFYMLAATVGLVMGGIQALSRATYTKLIPDDTKDTASYFSFYDVTEKTSLVLGTFTFGFIESFTGSMRNSILALLVYFVIGLLLLARIPSQKIYKYRLDSEVP